MATVTTTINAHISDGVASVHTTIKLGRKKFLTADLEGTRYELDWKHAKQLLQQLNAFGSNCSEGCRQLRKQLTLAIDGQNDLRP
jgi:hypothetical protein